MTDGAKMDAFVTQNLKVDTNLQDLVRPQKETNKLQTINLQLRVDDSKLCQKNFQEFTQLRDIIQQRQFGATYISNQNRIFALTFFQQTNST